MTTVTRILNFSSGPAVLPVPVLEQVQRDLLALPGVGMSVMEISHRSSTFEGILEQGRGRHPRAGRRSGELQGPVPAGRRQPAVLDGADEPARRGRDRRLRHDRHVGRQGGEGGEDGSGRSTRPARRRPTTTTAFRPRPSARSRPAPPTCTSRRTTRSKAPSGQRCRTSATCRSSATPRRTSSAARSTSRSTALIYAGAQKNLGPSGVTLVIIREDLLARSQQVAAHDAELRRARRERVAVQHAAGVRHLRARPGRWSGCGRRAAWPAMAAVNERKAGKLYAELDRTASGGRRRRRTAAA